MKLIAFLGALLMLASCQHTRPYNIDAPEFYLYQGRLLGVRYPLAVHTWFAYRKSSDSLFTAVHYMARIPGEGYSGIHRYQTDEPSAYWGSDPGSVICARYEEAALTAIAKLEDQLSRYPQDGAYWAFPGPNSNTYSAYTLGELGLTDCQLPATAIGKDFPVDYLPFSATPSGTGFRLSLFGLLGATFGWEEGIHINALGLSFGIDFKPFAIELPFIGRIGYSQFTEPPEAIRTN